MATPKNQFSWKSSSQRQLLLLLLTSWVFNLAYLAIIRAQGIWSLVYIYKSKHTNLFLGEKIAKLKDNAKPNHKVSLLIIASSDVVLSFYQLKRLRQEMLLRLLKNLKLFQKTVVTELYLSAK